MSDQRQDLEQVVEQQQQEIRELRAAVEQLKSRMAQNSIRRESDTRIAGLPLYSIAVGPDPERGEIRGHARGIFAFGDIATGVFALGGLARGLVAVGGLAFGGIAVGGCSLGLLLALGGVAVGGIAIGGCAIGYLAVGGVAVGAHVLDGNQQGPLVKQVWNLLVN